MKKTYLLLTSLLSLCACSNVNSYSELLEKIKTYKGENTFIRYEIATFEFDYDIFGFANDAGFLRSTVHHQNNSSEIIGSKDLKITLPNVSNVPENFLCEYSSEGIIGSVYHKESATFYIPNNVRHNTKIEFNTYKGEENRKESAQEIAKHMFNDLALHFDIWLKNEQKTSLEQLGLFPNYSIYEIQN